MTFVVSLYLSKAAVVTFLARLTKNKTWLMIYWICLGFIAALGIASVLVVTIGWPLKSGYYWAFSLNQEPTDSQVRKPTSPARPDPPLYTDPTYFQITRWYTFTALDLLTELLLLILPVHIVWGLQMPLKKKAMIIAAFYLRIPVIGISIGRLIYTTHLCNRDVDVGLESTLVLIWLEIETSYAIVSSTFSALKAFTMSFNSSFGLGFIANADEGDYYGLSRVTRNSQPGSAIAKDSRPVISQSTPSVSTLKQNFIVQNIEVPADASRFNSPVMRLQPDPAARSYAQVSSKKPVVMTQAWRENRSSSSERTIEDGVIVRERGYTVQHHDTNDELPILSRRIDGYDRR